MTRLTTIFVLALLSTPLRAQDRHERAAELAQRAQVLYEAGELAEAEGLLEEALLQVDDPALYYNLARTREQLEDWEGAASAYRAFMSRRPEDPRIPSVRERLHILDERAAEAAPEPEPEVEPEPEPEPEPLEAVEHTGPAVWSWVLMGAGAGIAAAGLAFGIISNGQADDARNAETGAAGSAALSDARRNAKLADISFALGGAFVVGGVLAALLTRGRVSVDASTRGALVRVHTRF